MGALGAAIGVLALLGGALLEPIHPVSDALSVAIAVFVRSLLALLALGVTLLLAYLAGYRIELGAPVASTNATASAADSATTTTSSTPTTSPLTTRTQAALAGVVILFAYWLGSTLYIVLLGARIGGIGAQNGGSPLSFTISHVILGG
ncbi:MAG: hypothetical protein ABI068_05925, partial [Ktedonobacterales bacterium]